MRERPYLVLYLILAVLGLWAGIFIHREYLPKEIKVDPIEILKRAGGKAVFHRVSILEEDGSTIIARKLTVDGENIKMEDGRMKGK